MDRRTGGLDRTGQGRTGLSQHMPPSLSTCLYGSLTSAHQSRHTPAASHCWQQADPPQPLTARTWAILEGGHVSLSPSAAGKTISHIPGCLLLLPSCRCINLTLFTHAWFPRHLPPSLSLSLFVVSHPLLFPSHHAFCPQTGQTGGGGRQEEEDRKDRPCCCRR